MSPALRSRVQAAGLLAIGIAPAEFNWAYNPHLVHQPVLFWLIDTFRWIILPPLIFFLGVRRKFFTPADVGFHVRVAGRSSWILFIAALIAVPIFLRDINSTLVSLGQDFAEQNFYPTTFSYDDMMPANSQSHALHMLLAIYFAVTAGVVEEFYYRGLLRHVVGRGETRAVYFVILSAALFIPPHLYEGSAGFAYTAVFAFVMAALYVGLGNIWPLILGHFLIDWGWFGK